MTRRFAALALAVAIALALGLAIGAWSERRAIARRFLVSALAARGADPVSLQVEEVGLRGLSLRDVTLGPEAEPTATIAALEAEWSFAGLRDRRLDRLSATGVRVRDASALSLGTDDATGAVPLLPAREIELRDALLTFATASGAGTAALELALRAPDDGTVAGDLKLTLDHPLARADGTVAISGTLDALAGQLSLELEDARTPARVAPATLSGRVSGAASALAFDLALDGAKGALHAEARGTADLPAGNASAELRIAPIAFAPKGLRPAALLPALEPVLTALGIANLSGGVEALGAFALKENEPSLSLDLALRNVSFETKLVALAGLSGAIAFRAPPLRTPKNQLFSVDRLEAGVTLRNGLTDFALGRDGAVEIASTVWSFFGGELRAEDVRIDPSAESIPLTLRAQGLDLAELLALAPLEGLEGTGRIDGELPIVRASDALRVSGGVLRARPGGGVIRYRASESVRAMAASRPNDLGVAVAAFGDFRYEELEARLDGDLNGELQIALHVRGASPEFQSGQPVELNLNLESRLADLVREGIAVYRVPAVIEERLREFSHKGNARKGKEGKP